MSGQFLDRDPLTGITTYFHQGEKPGTWGIETRQDVEAIIEHNKAMATATDGWSKSRNFRYVGSIPDNIQLKWFHDYGIACWKKDHWPAVKRLLNDPDWRYLRGASWHI